MLAAVLVAATAAGCSSSDSKSADGGAAPKAPEQIELEFWTINLKKNFESYITQNLIAEYEKTHPNIKIKWVDVPGAEMTRKLITALSSDDVPDLVNETNLGFSTLYQYNAVYPIGDLVEKSQLNGYIKGLVDGVTRDGKVMALPWYHGGPSVQFINTELYKKAGLDPEKPAKTYDELLANGKTIHEKLPNVYGSNDIPSTALFISEGLPVLSADRKTAVFDSPEHVAFVQKFVDGYKNGAIAPGAAMMDDRQLQQTLDNEQTAHSGQSFGTVVASWEKNVPSLLPKMKVAPAVTGKADKLGIADYQTFLIPKKSKHPKEAAEFALFVTSAQKQLEFCKLVAIFPSHQDTLKDPFFADVKGDKLSDQVRKVQVSTASKLVLTGLGFNNERQLNDKLKEEIIAALLGKKTTQQALKDAVAFWNRDRKSVV